MNNLMCLALDQNYTLAHSVATILKAPLLVPTISNFADGEISLHVSEEVGWQNQEVVLIAATHNPVQESIMHALFLVHALKQRKIKRLTWIIPYCAYARQTVDSQNSAYQGNLGACARMMQAVGVDQIVVVEPHDAEFSSLFSIPVQIIAVDQDIARDIQEKIPGWQECCIVAPDRGAVERAQMVANILSLPLVTCTKKRLSADVVKITQIEGYVGNRAAIIIDDILDTGGTALHTAQLLQEKGVQKIYGYFVHGVFSCGVDVILNAGLFTSVHISPTVPQPMRPKLHCFDIKQSLEEKLKQIFF